MSTTTAVKERPILMNGERVLATLAGRKTQTRRIAKLPDEWHRGNTAFDRNPNGDEEFVIHGPCGINQTYCPYGSVGDRLYVRETFADLRGRGFDQDFAYRAESLKDFGDGRGLCEDGDSERCRLDYGVKWTPSIHMPRLASRITLEITGVRVERLNEISEADAKAEGITDGGCLNCGTSSKIGNCGCHDPNPSYREGFIWLWHSLYGQDSWHENPWLWVVSFKKVEQHAR